MSDNYWETVLADLLRRLSSTQQELLSLLASKRELLLARDTEGLARLVPQEEALSEELHSCFETRKDLLRKATDQGLPSTNIRELALSLPGTDPVQKISIIPRGIAALGYTMQVPTEDRFLMKKTELLNKIASLLGGRAAEEIMFGDVSTGAHNDLAKATDIARSMVKEYGMSNKVGQVYFAREKRARFLDTAAEGAVEYSEATAELIDNEVREILSSQYSKALEILQEKKDILVKGARLLLEKEKIEGEELKTLMKDVSQATSDLHEP
jgi:hypothetical protein